MKILYADTYRDRIELTLFDDINKTVKTRNVETAGQHYKDLSSHVYGIIKNYDPNYVFVETNGMGIVLHDCLCEYEDIHPKIKGFVHRGHL